METRLHRKMEEDGTMHHYRTEEGRGILRQIQMVGPLSPRHHRRATMEEVRPPGVHHPRASQALSNRRLKTRMGEIGMAPRRHHRRTAIVPLNMAMGDSGMDLLIRQLGP